jgi:glycosyltransferase involved in cell wall biosynthesis
MSKVSKNIWLICKYAMPAKYFFGTRHFYLAEEWVRNGHDVTIFTSNWNHLTDKLPTFESRSLDEEINGVKTIWLRTFKNHSSGSIARIIAWIHFEILVWIFGRKEEAKAIPDVIIVSSLSLFSILSGYYFARKHKARFILEIRDIWPLTAIELGGYSARNPIMWMMSSIERLGYRNADVIIGTMPNLIQHVRNTEPQFKQCTCIPQGVTNEQLEYFEKLSDAYKRTIFNKPSFRIGYTGTMNKANPLKTLLEVATMLGPQSGVDFYFIGKGDQKAEYEKQYGLQKHIHFLDAIPKTQIRDFLNQIHVAYDSFHGDMGQFGLSRNKWMDYMTASKPIICSFSGYKSILNEANCGVFVPENDIDALKKAILSYKNMTPAELKSIGSNGFSFLKEFHTFPNLASMYEKHFK